MAANAHVVARSLATRSLAFSAVGAAVAVEAYAVGHDRTKIAALPALGVLVPLAVRRPVILVGAALALLTIAADPYRFRIGQGTVPQALIALALFGAVVSMQASLDLVGLAVAVFIAAMLGGIVVAHGRGVSFHSALLSASLVTSYLAYWPCRVAFLRNRERALRVLLLVGVVVASLSILQEVFRSHSFFLDQGGVIVSHDANGFLRIRPQGLLVYACEFFVLAAYLWGPREARRRLLAPALILSASIAISLNRNWFLGLVGGLALAALIARKDRASTRRLAILTAIVVLTLVAGAGTSVGERFLSLGNAGALERTTLADRAYENRIARRVLFHQHPLFGVGWSDYGAQVAVSIGTAYELQPRPFIHNQWYGVWLRGGILALVSLVAAFALAVWRAATRLRRDGDWLAAGVLAALVGIAASSFVGIYVIHMASGVTVAALFALASTMGGRRGVQQPADREVA